MSLCSYRNSNSRMSGYLSSMCLLHSENKYPPRSQEISQHHISSRLDYGLPDPQILDSSSRKTHVALIYIHMSSSRIGTPYFRQKMPSTRGIVIQAGDTSKLYEAAAFSFLLRPQIDRERARPVGLVSLSFESLESLKIEFEDLSFSKVFDASSMYLGL